MKDEKMGSRAPVKKATTTPTKNFQKALEDKVKGD